jgi:hypothetical protein
MYIILTILKAEEKLEVLKISRITEDMQVQKSRAMKPDADYGHRFFCNSCP